MSVNRYICFMSVQILLDKLKQKQIVFKDVLDYIQENYSYTPSAFTNGSQVNSAEENQGSARVLFFAKLENLSQEDTLSLFAEHYESVLATPDQTDHQNIRQFQMHGFQGLKFENDVLKK